MMAMKAGAIGLEGLKGSAGARKILTGNYFPLCLPSARLLLAVVLSSFRLCAKNLSRVTIGLKKRMMD